MKFIFLDFDGVLHANYGKDSALWTLLPRFESVLRGHPDARVVVSISWGDGRSVEQLREFFSPDIRPRIVDKVQTLRRRIHGHGDRGRACALWCRRHKLRAGDWLAIDDNSQLFLRTMPLIHCTTGFREEEELQLRMVLADEIPAWRFAFQTMSTLFYLEFDRDAQRTREYVLVHRPEMADGQPLAQLLFARKRRTVERHMDLMDAMRPLRPPLTDEQMMERHGYSSEQLRSLGGSFKPRCEEEG